MRGWLAGLVFMLTVGVAPAVCADVPSPATVLEKLRTYDTVYSAALTVRGSIVHPPPFNAPSAPRIKCDFSLSKTGPRQALIESAVDLPLQYKPSADPGQLGRRTDSADKVPYDVDGNMVLSYQTDTVQSFEDDRSAELLVSTVFVLGMGDLVVNRAKNRTITYCNHDAVTLIVPVQTALWALGRGYGPHLDEVQDVTPGPDGLLTVKALGTFDARQHRGRWVLAVDPQAQYLVRRAEFYSPTGAKEPSVVVTNSDIKRDGGCIFPATGECDLRVGGTGPRVYTFRELRFTADPDLFATARRATEETDLPRTTVLDRRQSPPKSTYIDKNGRQIGREPAVAATNDPPSEPSTRARTLVIIVLANLLLFAVVVLTYFIQKRRKARPDDSH